MAGQEELVVILPSLAQDVVEEQLDAVESDAFASRLESDASLPADAEALEVPIVNGVDADHVDEVSPPLPPDLGRVERAYLDWITNMSRVES